MKQLLVLPLPAAAFGCAQVPLPLACRPVWVPFMGRSSGGAKCKVLSLQQGPAMGSDQAAQRGREPAQPLSSLWLCLPLLLGNGFLTACPSLMSVTFLPCHAEESPAPRQPLVGNGSCCYVPLKLSLLQAEPALVLQPHLTGWVLQLWLCWWLSTVIYWCFLYGGRPQTWHSI